MITSSLCGRIAMQVYSLPIIAMSTWPSMRNFRTYREIVFFDICNNKLTSPISKPRISVNQIALHHKSWLYTCSMLTITFTPGLAIVNYCKERYFRSHHTLHAHSLSFHILTLGRTTFFEIAVSMVDK